MESLKEDKLQVQKIRKLIKDHRELDPDHIEGFARKYEELIELTEVSFEMIDHLVQKLQNKKSV